MDQMPVDQGMPPAAGAAPAAPPAGGEMQAPNPEIMSPLIQQFMPQIDKMTQLMDPKMGDSYDRVVTAGMKMLYSQENAEMMHSIVLNDEIPVANKLGEGIANLMVMMDNQGNGTIPKEIMVPAGITLMFEAADYLFEIGVEVTEEDLGAALELLMKGILVGYGIDPAAMDKVIDAMGQKLGFESTGDEDGEAVTGSPAPGEKGIEPMDEEAAFQQGFKDERKAQITGKE